MFQNPLVSIIIPSFNRENIILETLISIKNQSYSNFECIVVDDHSTDNTFESVFRFTKSDKRFRILKRKQKEKGASVCRNEGIKLAGGHFIMFLDSDDLLAPDCFLERVKFSKKKREADFYIFQAGIFNDSTYYCETLWSNIDSENPLNSFVWSKGWSISNSFFKANFLKDNHLFNQEAQSWQDVEFHIRALLKKPIIGFSKNSKPDVFIRFSNISRVSNTNLSFQRIKSRLNIYLSIEEEFLNSGYSEFLLPFKIYFFKYLEISARTHRNEEFLKLYSLWQKSETFRFPKYNYMKTYLIFQSFLTKMKLYYVGSIFYKIIRLILPLKILNVNNRTIKLKEAINVKKLILEN